MLHPPCYLHSKAEALPTLPCPQCTFRTLLALSPLQRPLPPLERWKWFISRRFSHKPANGQVATQPTLQRAIHSLGLCPGERPVCNKCQITRAWNDLFVFSLLLFIKWGITYLLLPPVKQFICTHSGFGERPNFIFTLTKPFHPLPPLFTVAFCAEWMNAHSGFKVHGSLKGLVC